MTRRAYAAMYARHSRIYTGRHQFDGWCGLWARRVAACGKYFAFSDFQLLPDYFSFRPRSLCLLNCAASDTHRARRAVLGLSDIVLSGRSSGFAF